MFRILLRYGSFGIVGSIVHRIRNKLPVESNIYKKHSQRFALKNGIEFGGPSKIFSKYGAIPIYNIVESLDNCNFSCSTIWEGFIQTGENFYFNKQKKPGMQYVSEASNLTMISDSNYDFIISSHLIEHCANPVKTLLEWKRVLKKGGIILIVAPIKHSNFDHKRDYTTFDHLLSDYQLNVGEDDLTHLEEILEQHDLRQDPHAGTLEEFRLRMYDNFTNRGMHHHVFNQDLMEKLLNFVGFVCLDFESINDTHLVVLGKKVE